jgi:hypothetical protein
MRPEVQAEYGRGGRGPCPSAMPGEGTPFGTPFAPRPTRQSLHAVAPSVFQDLSTAHAASLCQPARPLRSKTSRAGGSCQPRARSYRASPSPNSASPTAESTAGSLIRKWSEASRTMRATRNRRSGRSRVGPLRGARAASAQTGRDSRGGRTCPPARSRSGLVLRSRPSVLATARVSLSLCSRAPVNDRFLSGHNRPSPAAGFGSKSVRLLAIM